MMAIERGEGYDTLVGRSDARQHAARFGRDDVGIWLLKEGGHARAFAILEGLTDPHGGVYLRRIATAERGQGLGPRLLRATLAWSFLDMDAPRYWLDVLQHNFQARKVYAQAGMQDEGVMRQAYRLPDGSRIDRIIMSILATEWRAAQGFAVK